MQNVMQWLMSQVDPNKQGGDTNQSGTAGRDLTNLSVAFHAMQEGKDPVAAVKAIDPNFDRNQWLISINQRLKRTARGTPEWFKLFSVINRVGPQEGWKDIDKWFRSDEERALYREWAASPQGFGQGQSGVASAPSANATGNNMTINMGEKGDPAPLPWEDNADRPIPPIGEYVQSDSILPDAFVPDEIPTDLGGVGDEMLPDAKIDPKDIPTDPFAPTIEGAGPKFTPGDVPGYSYLPAALGGAMGLIGAFAKDPEFNRHETSQFWRDDFKREFEGISEDARTDPYQGDFFRNANRAAQTATNTMLGENANMQARQAAVTGNMFGGGTERALAKAAPGFYANQGNLLSRGYQIRDNAARMENRYTNHNTDQQQQLFEFEVAQGTHPAYSRGLNLVNKAMGGALAGASAFDDLYANMWERDVMGDLYAKWLGKYDFGGKDGPGNMTQKNHMWYEPLSKLGLPGKYGTQHGPMTEQAGKNARPWDMPGVDKSGWPNTPPAQNPINKNMWYHGGAQAGPPQEAQSGLMNMWQMPTQMIPPAGTRQPWQTQAMDMWDTTKNMANWLKGIF
jgi:hypothetical protein